MYNTEEGLNALEVASQIHESVNQNYGTYYPYRLHLQLVCANIVRFFETRKESMDHREYLQDLNVLFSAGAYHDLIEDCRLTYNEMLQMKEIQILYPNEYGIPSHNRDFHKRTIDLVYACTETKGRSRAERHGDLFKEELYSTSWAWFVKLCDTLANSTWSRISGSSMLEKYQAEVPHFLEELYDVKQNDPDFDMLIFQEMVREFEFVLHREIEL